MFLFKKNKMILTFAIFLSFNLMSGNLEDQLSMATWVRQGCRRVVQWLTHLDMSPLGLSSVVSDVFVTLVHLKVLPNLLISKETGYLFLLASVLCEIWIITLPYFRNDMNMRTWWRARCLFTQVVFLRRIPIQSTSQYESESFTFLS